MSDVATAARNAKQPCPTVSDAEDLLPGETLPTSAEIAQACKEIRSNWTAKERRKRAKWATVRFAFPVVRTTKEGKTLAE